MKRFSIRNTVRSFVIIFSVYFLAATFSPFIEDVATYTYAHEIHAGETHDATSHDHSDDDDHCCQCVHVLVAEAENANSFAVILHSEKMSIILSTQFRSGEPRAIFQPPRV